MVNMAIMLMEIKENYHFDAGNHDNDVNGMTH